MMILHSKPSFPGNFYGCFSFRVNFMANPTHHGLFFSGERFEVTSVAGGSKRASVTGAIVVSEGEGGADALNLDSLLGLHRKKLSGELHVAVPASSVLMHTADFPASDPAELEGMVELCVEDLSPYPVDRTYFGWEVLASTASGSRVLMVLTSSSAVDALHDALKAHKLLAHRVDVDVLGWWHLISKQDRFDGSRLVMLLDENQAHLLAVHRGVLTAATTLRDIRDCPGEVLAEDVELALGGMEADRGALEFDEVVVWSRGAMPEVFRSLELDRRFACPLHTRDLKDLPPLTEGVARRGLTGGLAGEGAKPLDLSPPSWKEEEAMRVSRRRLISGAAAAGILWILFAGGLTGYVRYQENHVRSLRRELEAQRQPVENVRALSNQVRSLSQFTDRSQSALEVLRIMAEAAPGGGRILVRDVHYRKHEGVNFSGEATGDFLLFQEVLGESDILRVQDFDTTQTRGVTEFRMVTRWRWQDETEGSP
jgi:hypothetical protein